MGWASYIEDIEKRFEYTTHPLRKLPEVATAGNALEYTKAHADLARLQRDTQIVLQAFRVELEIITDPAFDAHDKWQSRENEVAKLKIQNNELQAKLKQQEIEAAKQLSDMGFQYHVKIGTLEAKLKNERHEAERSLKSAKTKR